MKMNNKRIEIKFHKKMLKIKRKERESKEQNNIPIDN